MTICEHPSRIDELTAAVEKLKSTQLPRLLYARSQAHFDGQNLDGALADGHELLKIVPNSPLGYLCIGQVHAAKSRLSDALWYYTAGLAQTTAAAADDSERKKLWTCAEQARTQLEHRMDWVKLMPVDVIALILAELSVKDCWALSRVCRDWWRTIPTGMYLVNRNPRITPANRRQMIHLINIHTQSLTFEKCVPTPHLVRCQNLRKLVLYECTIVDMEELFSSLKAIGSKTLRDLSVTIHPRYDLIALDGLLKECPHLTHFTYHAPHHALTGTETSSNFFSLVSTAPLKLQHLSWDVDPRWWPLERWLSRMPELKTLRIPYRTRQRGRHLVELPGLLRNNPNVTHLDFHSTFPNDPAPWIDVSSSGQQGLIELHMGWLSEYMGEDIIRFTQAHQSTLRVLRIAVDANDSARSGHWSSLVRLSFDVLQTLHLANLDRRSTDLSNVFQNSPALTDVAFKRIDSTVESVLRGPLLHREHLSRLAFVDCPNLSNASLNRVFMHAKGRLRHVVLDRVNLLAVQTLCSLATAHGETLEHVELNTELRPGAHSGLLPFVELLRPHAVLRHLSVGHTNALTPDTVHALADHPNLTSVAFVRCPRLTGDAVRLLVDKSTSLKRIRVAFCPAVSDLTLHYVRGVLGRDAVMDDYSAVA